MDVVLLQIILFATALTAASLLLFYYYASSLAATPQTDSGASLVMVTLPAPRRSRGTLATQPEYELKVPGPEFIDQMHEQAKLKQQELAQRFQTLKLSIETRWRRRSSAKRIELLSDVKSEVHRAVAVYVPERRLFDAIIPELCVRTLSSAATSMRKGSPERRETLVHLFYQISKDQMEEPRSRRDYEAVSAAVDGCRGDKVSRRFLPLFRRLCMVSFLAEVLRRHLTDEERPKKGETPRAVEAQDALGKDSMDADAAPGTSFSSMFRTLTPVALLGAIAIFLQQLPREQ